LRKRSYSYEELVTQLASGEEVFTVYGIQPMAKLVRQLPSPLPLRQPGSARGKLSIIAEDDEHLTDFTEYLS